MAMDILDFETIPGEEDAIEGLLDPMDLLDGIELGEFDFPPAGFEQGLENSDSDSGISVSCENVLLGRTHSLTAPTTTVTKSTPVVPDLVLTDAVYSSFSPSSVAKQTAVSGSSFVQHSTTQNITPAKPVRIFKLCNGTPGRPAFITPIESNVQGPTYRSNIGRLTAAPNPSQSLNTTTRTLGHSVIVQTKSPVLSDSVTTKETPKITPNPYMRVVKPDPEILVTGEFSSTASQPEFTSFLDDYDPTLYSDVALEEHLRDIYGQSSSTSVTPALGSHAAPFPLGSTSHYLPSAELLSSNDCLLTHTSLERLRKKQERMIKNRHAASMSRLRKKEYLERLEMRYEQLKRENINLWRQNEEWRVRCNELERNLTELQSQLSNYDSSDSHPDNGTPSDSSSAPSTPPLQTVNTISPPDLTRKTAAHSLPVSVTVSGASLLHAFSTPTRNSLTTLSIQTPQSTDQTSLKWVNGIDLAQPPVLDKRSQPPSNRKTVANSVFYPGKGSILTKSNESVPARVHRPNLLNLSGVVSRQLAGSRLHTNRAKIVATTSLLSILCLFSLNIFLSPFDSGMGATGISDAHLQYGNVWNPPQYAAGQRLLLSFSEPVTSPPENSDTAGDQEQEINVNGSRCNPADNGQFDVDCIWQLWIQQNKMNHSNQSREPLSSSHGGLQYSTQPLHGKNDLSSRHQVRNPSRAYHNPSETNEGPDSYLIGQQSRLSSAPSQDVNNMVENTSVLATKRANSRRLSPMHRPTKVVPQRGLQPFYRRFVWYQEDLLEAAGRRNDTVYFILSKIDAVHVFDPAGDSPARKITLIVPAYRTQNVSNFVMPTNESDPRLIMLQVDCDLRNVTFIHPPEKPVEAPRN
ncbi:bZIP transcription factor [Opisthorchis viverrini]|uniref:BZIP transcription factor n=1 Tax=Opisthorchis viverrini TaxID=6198 RepID=A0A1S8WUJ9_OPIVI|nr:bZIP transcription factor [Opisthorchis viverrini]